MDYVGFWLDYGRFEIGLSEKRAAWIISSAERFMQDGWLINVKKFHEFHGRLGFSSQVLPWLKPLLGPGYAWIAAVGRNSTLKMPELVAAVCTFVK